MYTLHFQQLEYYTNTIIMDIFNWILFIVWCLQVNDSTSWEQKGVWRGKCERDCSNSHVWSSLLIYIFIPKTSAGTNRRHRRMEELSGLICVVFIFGFVLGQIWLACHIWYQSSVFRRHVSELEEALIWISVFLSQWICTVNNISRQIYLTDNPEVTHTPTRIHTTAHTCCMLENIPTNQKPQNQAVLTLNRNAS